MPSYMHSYAIYFVILDNQQARNLLMIRICCEIGHILHDDIYSMSCIYY